MKKLLAGVSLCLMVLLFGFSFAGAAETPGEETIRVGYFQFSGYHMQDADGRRSGYGYEFLQRIGNYMDCTFEYVGYEDSYSHALDMLEQGEVDLVTSVSRTPEREERFLFSDRSIGTNSTLFTVKAGNESVVAGDYATYDGLTIGMLDGNSKNSNFESFAEEHDFTFQPVYFETEQELTAALQDGSVDGIITGSLRATRGEWQIESFAASEFYVCTGKEDRELMDRINAAITQLDLDDPDWRSVLHKKYYALDDGGLVMLSPEERTYFDALLNEGTVLKILVNPDRQPYSYFEDGQPRGILVDVFERIAEKLKVPYEFLETRDRGEYYQLRVDGAADVVLDFASDYYLAESEGYKITDPYVNTGFTRLVRKGYSGEIHKVATVSNSDVLSRFVEDRYGKESVIYCESVDACVQAVLKGDADATVLYTYAAEKALQDDIRNQLNFVIMGDESFSYAIGVNVRDGYLLRSILNKGLSSIGEDEIAALILKANEYQEPDVRKTLISFLYDNPIYAILGVLFLSLFVLILLLSLARLKSQKELRRKIADVSAKYEQQKLELNEALSAANAASQAKSLFLFNMSHDIRTPMNAIIGFADIAQKHLQEPEVVENAVTKIRTSSEILLNLINDVLDLARIESGKTTLDLTPTDLAADMENVRMLFEEDMEKAGIAFTMEQDLSDTHVLCDSLRINQILINLLGNARKFTHSGGKVICRVKQLEEAKDGTAPYEITVEDNGIGMSEEFQKRVFDRFERERTSTVSGIQGSGLGLAIVKRVVDMMGGTIEVASTLGKGTTFTINFRLQVLDQEKVEKPQTDTREEILFEGRRILLVEDNELNREIAREILKEEGFEVEEAEDGTVAVEKVSHSEPGYYDLVLMDIQMPVMDGYTATREIRNLKDPRLSQIPIIAMTANAFDEDRKQALKMGMNGHLSKPIDVDSLLKVLRTVLHGEKKEQER